MRYTTPLLLLLPLLLTACNPPSTGDATIEYRGQTFKLAKRYPTFEDYKDDAPDNLLPSEIPAIEKAILDAKPPATLHDRTALIHEMFQLKFPGYGLTSGPESPQPDGSRLVLHAIEIPHRDKDRILTYRTVGNTYTLIDDFTRPTPPGAPEIFHVHLLPTQLVYTDLHDTPVFTRPYPSPTTHPTTTSAPAR